MKRNFILLFILPILCASSFAIDYFSIPWNNGTLHDYAGFEDLKTYTNNSVESIQIIAGVDYDKALRIQDGINKLTWEENKTLNDLVKLEMDNKGLEYSITSRCRVFIINRKYKDKYYIKMVQY